MGESPVDKKKMQSKIYSTGKAKKISMAVKRKLLVNVCSDDENDDSQDEFFMPSIVEAYAWQLECEENNAGIFGP